MGSYVETQTLLLQSLNNHYYPKNHNPCNNLLYLYEFFSEMYGDVEKYINHLLSPSFKSFYNNYAFIKCEGDTDVIIGCELDEMENQCENFLKCTRDQLIDAFRQWGNALKIRPSRIMIQRDDSGDLHIFALPEETCQPERKTPTIDSIVYNNDRNEL